ncbi:DUF6468 domain-containing protein [Paeniroseomonas aquatica]|uniref:DUF6468 domain-containing protein n=1 Tax=Paeniroseomonas aquatica TaxID=373043 RepID=A0ABT8AC53_9PROT|nr:DUF6468 domain-containing protein [Paeniroseomonas aquatica]MDN3567349.1 DUF6468 domain-containing protein [Paeniroseomonas aquatica]
MGWLEWSAQALLTLLLAAAMPFIIRLERGLAAVRRDRLALEASAAGLGEATRMAEAASIRLRASAEGAGRQVAEKLAAAEPMRDDLRYLVERAESLADRLDGLVRTARPLAAADAQAHHAAAPPAQSQAERDLLRVLTQGVARPAAARGGR